MPGHAVCHALCFHSQTIPHSITNNAIDKEYNESCYQNNQSYSKTIQSYYQNNQSYWKTIQSYQSSRYEIRKELLLVKVPDFTNGKQQMPPLEVERSRKIANVRIHVERVIGNLWKKYSLLNLQLPIDFLMRKENAEYCTIDKIVTICCALSNLCDSVVPFD